MKYFRALGRSLAAIGMVAVLVPLQVFVAAPLRKNYTTIPRMLMRGLRHTLNVNLAVRGEVDDKRQSVIVSNHMSWLDILLLGSLYRGAFIGKKEIASVPALSRIGKSAKTIFIERTRDYLPVAHAELAGVLNEGHNVIVFPEGTTTDGSEVNRFRAGLLKILFNETSGNDGRMVSVDRKIMIQPIALRVLAANGRDATEDQSQRDIYSWYGEGPFLSHLWRALTAESMTVGVTILPALDPEDFSSPVDLVNAAHKMVRDVVIGCRHDASPARFPEDSL